jgi:hypothetical protein
MRSRARRLFKISIAGDCRRRGDAAP